MIDVHVHLEKGEYSKEWLEQFVSWAVKRNVDEVWFLEHTHVFMEFRSLYDEMADFNEYQKEWFRKKEAQAKPIEIYLDFVEKMKNISFPIKTNFGLEVCYSPEHEKDIECIRENYPLDFMVGAIHFIDGWAFSHKRQSWKTEDYDLTSLYGRYYELMLKLVESNLFSGLAHPNSLQCFGAYPVGDHSNTYHKLAKALHERGMYIEESGGLALSYENGMLGMNEQMLDAMITKRVSILTASDAHFPKDAGRNIKEMNEILSRKSSNYPKNFL